MSRGVVWQGLAEYRAELAALPDDCLREAGKSIEGETNAAFVAVANVYESHRVTGNLRNGLSLSALTFRGRLTAGRVLKSNAPHAHLFDLGRQTFRPYPPTHTFSRAVGQARRRLALLFRAMLLRKGATQVTGE